MIYPFDDNEEISKPQELVIPREYGINFKTGQLTGKVVEGLEAIKAWAWMALQTPRYRHLIYSWDYGQELEDLIGKGYSDGYIEAEVQRMLEECLIMNPNIEGIDELVCDFRDGVLVISFLMITTWGEVKMNVRGNDI